MRKDSYIALKWICNAQNGHFLLFLDISKAGAFFKIVDQSCLLHLAVKMWDRLPELESLLSVMLRLNKRKAGNVQREVWCIHVRCYSYFYCGIRVFYIKVISCKVWLIYHAYHLFHFYQIYLFLIKNIKPKLLFLFVNFMQAVLYGWLKLSPCLRQHTVLKATKRTQPNVYFPTSILLW